MAVTISPGQVVDAATWNALFTQHGGMSNDQQAANVSTKPTDAGYLPRDKQQPIYRYFLIDGSTVDARTDASGQGWEIVKYEPSAKFTADQKAADTPSATTTVRGQTTDYEGTPDPSAPGGFDNERPRKVTRGPAPDRVIIKVEPMDAADLKIWTEQRERSRNRQAGLGDKTDAQLTADKKTAQAEADRARADLPGRVSVPVQGHPGIFLVTTKNPQTNQQESHYENSAGQTVPEPPDAPSYQAASREINGQVYTTITALPKDGSAPTITHYGPDGKPIGSLPQKGVGNRPDLPQYTPDLTKPGLGLSDYARSLDQYMQDHPDFTWEQRQEVLRQAQTEGKSVADEFNLGASLLQQQYQYDVTQRGQDITQSNARATLANQHFENALGLVSKFSPYLGQVEGNAGRLFMGLMASQLATATAYGGMRDVPRAEMDPRLLAAADRWVGRVTGPGVTGAQPSPPGPSPAGANALGLGAIGNVPAPGGAGPSGLPAPIFGPPPAVGADPMAGRPTAGEPGGPPLAAGPVWEPPQAAPAAATPPARDDWRLAPAVGTPDLGDVGAADGGATAWPALPAAPGLQGLSERAIPAGTPSFGDGGLGMMSRREVARAAADVLTMPQGAASVAGLFGPGPQGSPFGSQGYSLDDAIDREARRQVALEGIG